jgi:hypothetical protein
MGERSTVLLGAGEMAPSRELEGPDSVTPKNPYTVGRLRREQRYMRLVKLGYRSYPEYLRSRHWQRKRLEYAGSDRPQDCICGETEGLQLHHTTYERVGDEALTDLTPLCPACHAMIHTLEARGDIGLDFTGFVNKQRGDRHKAEIQAEEFKKLLSAWQAVAIAEDLRRGWQGVRAPREGRLFHHRVKAELKRLEARLDVHARFS